ncbi:MAG TPA: phosphatase PAP2 family protein [Polyangiaceae bacterium]|jgi:membrane-associated phospholipid phosphatase|nr:phosphatase PAP2 family protein [Polyangiaceae bacterium]
MAGIALVWAGLAIACTSHDLAISRALVRPDCAWAAFGQRFGELPGVTAFALAAFALYAEPAAPLPRSRPLRELPWLLCSIALGVALALIAYRLSGERLRPLGWGCTLMACAATTRIWRRSLAEGRTLSPRARRACSWTVRLTISVWLIVSLMKLAWGRVRFRDLSPLASEYTPWYSPQGWTGHVSFPSGHAAVGWLLLPALLLWPPGSRGYRWMFAASLAWGTFVAASRVVIGAHYASDVLFSSALAFALMALAPWQAARAAEAPSPREPQGAQRAPVPAPGLPDDGK